LGIALHKALALAYEDWTYQQHRPQWKWFNSCWNRSCNGLSEKQIVEGRKIFKVYFDKRIATRPIMKKPLGIEGQIKATIQFDSIEFLLIGRYGRLDHMEIPSNLELFDYKSSLNATVPEAIDVRLGVYYLGLEQTYRYSLKRLTLEFIRSGTTLSFDVTEEHREQVRSLIADLATKLRADDEWVPKVGEHCKRCGFAKYCAAKTAKPEPLLENGRKRKQVQLTLAV
jgi:putative RecB family exonuclease